MKYAKPSSGFTSILSGKTRLGHTGFDVILSDVKKATADLPSDKQLKILRTLRKIQANPRSVGTRDARATISALGKTRHLASAYKQNVAGAISHLRAQTGPVGGSTRAEARMKQRREAAGIASGEDDTALTGKAKKERMRELARERRREAEAEKSGTVQKYTTSASRWGKETKVSVTETKKSDAPPPEEAPKKPLIDLMID